VDLLYDVLHAIHGPLKHPRIIDPACGEGALLRGAVQRGLTPESRVFGVERDPEVAARALTQSGGPNAAVADSLLGFRLPIDRGFDLVVANPPYGAGAAGLREMPGSAARHLASAYRLWAIRGRSGKPDLERLRSYPAEFLFLELCLGLAREGGRVAILLPEGVAANARHRSVREWLLSTVQLDAVIGLPRGTFRRTGAAAKTCLLVLTKQPPGRGHRVLLGEVTDWDEPTHGRWPVHFAARRRQSSPELLKRLDPTYWHPGHDALLEACRAPLDPLDGYIRDITYGPIVTGKRPGSARRGVPLVNQGQVRFCGVDLADASRVPEDSPWVAERSMLRPGDVVLPRSGEGSLGKHRVAVYLDDSPAGVGSFVDLIRLEGLNPFYLAAFLKSRLGRSQVSRAANGVGVPNISFDEIRALQIPRLSPERQQGVERRYRREVLPHHRRAVARHARLCRSDADPRRDAALRRHREAGERRWRAVIEALDAELFDPSLAGPQPPAA
jgi:hypothetical protein